MRGIAGARFHRLDADDPWAVLGERKSLQHNTFSALHVDRHEVDGMAFIAWECVVEDLIERSCWHLVLSHLEPALEGRARLSFIQGAKTGAWDSVEGHGAASGSRRRLNDHVVRPVNP